MQTQDVPTYNDYSFADIQAKVEPLLAQGWTVHQKWTCKHCRSRQTMEETNRFFASGKCEECKEVTIIQKCNFLAVSPRRM